MCVCVCVLIIYTIYLGTTELSSFLLYGLLYFAENISLQNIHTYSFFKRLWQAFDERKIERIFKLSLEAVITSTNILGKIIITLVD